MIDAAGVRELLDYDQATGDLRWRKRTSNRVYVGDVAGWIGDNGYRRIEIDSTPYLVHRLIWLWMTGEWPAVEVDHRDGNRANNRWDNLRAASIAQNRQNMRGHAAVKGAYFNKRTDRWYSAIRANGKRKHLGSFNTQSEAAAAYQRASVALHGEFARPT